MANEGTAIDTANITRTIHQELDEDDTTEMQQDTIRVASIDSDSSSPVIQSGLVMFMHVDQQRRTCSKVEHVNLVRLDDIG